MHEVERKFEATDDRPVDWEALPGVGDPAVFTLRATYVDTPDLQLFDAGWLVRRRAGGPDAGWHLKEPADHDSRIELQEPDAARLPASLRAQVTRAFGRVPLVPVAGLVTERAQRTIIRDGIPAALVAVDYVNATVSAVLSQWCEVEVELVEHGDVAFLDEMEARLMDAGYPRAQHSSKIARALSSAPRSTPATDPSAPARDVLLAYLGKQVGALQALEGPVLDDAPGAVHKSRVATRRLRSLLRTFEPLLDEAWAEELRDELKWLAEMLGAPRDAEVLRREFVDLLAELDSAALDGPVADRILGHLAARHESGHAALRAAMASDRYTDLHDRLISLLTAAPWQEDAQAAAGVVLPPLVEVSRRRVAKLVARAEKRPDELERWHEVRKAAKAVRYCTEALVDAFGPAMREVAQRWTDVTEAFGTLQDAVVAHDLLAEVASLADAAGEPLTTYRVLADAQDDRAETALAEGKRVVLEALAR